MITIQLLHPVRQVVGLPSVQNTIQVLPHIMSAANDVERVAVPAVRAEAEKDVAIVTPDVVEVRIA